MLNKYLVLLIVIQWKLAQAQLAICESSGFCQETGQSCQGDSMNSCFLGSGAVPRKHVTYDDQGTGEAVQTLSTGSRCTVPDTIANISLKNLTVNYVSINPRYLKLRVSWSLTETSGLHGGYELRVIYSRTSLNFCIGNSSRTRVTIHNIRYDNLENLKSIDVLPYPYSRTNENEIMVSQPIHQNIEGCADVEHNGTICGSKPYSMPENLSVESSWCRNDTKTLNIKWDPPIVGSNMPLPGIYYVSLYSDPFDYFYTQRFTVWGSNQVRLLNLSATQNYKVYIKPYRKCSGLGNAAENLGCGTSAKQTEKKIYNNCDSFKVITTLNSNEGTVVEPSNATNDVNHVPVLATVIVTLNIVLIIALSLVVFLCAKLIKHLKGENHSCKRPMMMVDCMYKVFVFYSSSVSTTYKDYIQKYVICNLLKYFKVVTLDDVIRGNISIWLEDAVNSADSVLLVGDEEFCSEWEKDARSPILNSLELLISAAASQNTIAKFGFILTGESRTDISIPGNSYLKLMPVFYMGENKCEVEKIYRFVTRSRGIELPQESMLNCHFSI